MKILHIVAGLWEDTGGPAEVIPNLCLELVKQGHSVTILTVEGKHSQSLIDAYKGGVELISLRSQYFHFCRFVPDMFSYLLRNAEKFDIIHNHGHWLYPNWLSAYFSRKKNIPFITTPHGTLVPGMLNVSTYKKQLSWILFDRFIIKQANYVHCLSDQEKKLTLQKVSVDDSKIIVIPNAASDSAFKSNIINSIDGDECNKINILFMSRVSKIKGIEDLINVWEEVDTSNLTLTIVGPWDVTLSDLKEKASSTSNINIVGPIYGDERFKYLKNVEVFILPSYGEGLPTALLEASANGKYIVCTNECNFDQLKEIDGGYFFDAGEDNLKIALNDLINSELDMRQVIANNALNLAVENYSWRTVASKWEYIYQEAINESISSNSYIK